MKYWKIIAFLFVSLYVVAFLFFPFNISFSIFACVEQTRRYAYAMNDKNELLPSLTKSDEWERKHERESERTELYVSWRMFYADILTLLKYALSFQAYKLIEANVLWLQKCSFNSRLFFGCWMKIFPVSFSCGG